MSESQTENIAPPETAPEQQETSSSPPVFSDETGAPIAIFLPYSLPNRRNYVEKILAHAGKPVASEVLDGVIRIGDPARAASLSAGFFSFKYIDECIAQGTLVDPTPFAIQRPEEPQSPPAPTTQPRGSSFGNRLSGRNQFTPEDDQILRRLAHRSGVATSGNKIYQLIEQEYGGHTFHSWRDRYLRYLRPIWDAPTEETDIDITSAADAEILSGLPKKNKRHVSQVFSGNEEDGSPSTRSPSTREPFTENDDRLLIQAINRSGATTVTYKALAHDYSQHTFESWKNRKRVLEKKHGGVLPTVTQVGRQPEDDDAGSDKGVSFVAEPISELEAQPAVEQQGEQQAEVSAPLEPDIDVLAAAEVDAEAIAIDPNLESTGDLAMPDAEPEAAVDAVDDAPTAEKRRPGRPKKTTTEAADASAQPSRQTRGTTIKSSQDPTADATAHAGQRSINIHDPNADERDDPVSDIDDSTLQSTARSTRGKATARRGGARAGGVPRTSQRVPQTPLKQVETQAVDPKSAKLQHHEKTLSKPALVSDLAKASNLAILRGLPSASQSTAPEEADNIATGSMDDDDLRATEQLSNVPRSDKPAAELVAEDSAAAARASRAAKGKRRGTTPLREVEKTPNSSPVQVPVSQLRAGVRTVDPPSPTPASPAKRAAATAGLPTSTRRSVRQQRDDAAGIDVLLEETDEMLANAGETNPTNDENIIVYADPDDAFNTQAAAALDDYSVPGFPADAEDDLAAWQAQAFHTYSIDESTAELIYDQVMGKPALMTIVAESMATGEPLPPTPGVWTAEDDAKIQSTDKASIKAVDRFHNQAEDTRKGSAQKRLEWLGIGRQ